MVLKTISGTKSIIMDRLLVAPSDRNNYPENIRPKSFLHEVYLPADHGISSCQYLAPASKKAASAWLWYKLVYWHGFYPLTYGENQLQWSVQSFQKRRETVSDIS